MTATVVMRLVERGALDLDAPVLRYIPAFRLRDAKAQEQATVRHLVTHTGGWLGDCFADFGNGDDALERYVTAMAELEQITPLGEICTIPTRASHCLRLIEVANGNTYEEATRECCSQTPSADALRLLAGERSRTVSGSGHVIVDEKPTVARRGRSRERHSRRRRRFDGQRPHAPTRAFTSATGTTPDGARLLSRASLDLMRTHTPTTPTSIASGLVVRRNRRRVRLQ